MPINPDIDSKQETEYWMSAPPELAEQARRSTALSTVVTDAVLKSGEPCDVMLRALASSLGAVLGLALKDLASLESMTIDMAGIIMHNAEVNFRVNQGGEHYSQVLPEGAVASKLSDGAH